YKRSIGRPEIVVKLAARSGDFLSVGSSVSCCHRSLPLSATVFIQRSLYPPRSGGLPRSLRAGSSATSSSAPSCPHFARHRRRRRVSGWPRSEYPIGDGLAAARSLFKGFWSIRAGYARCCSGPRAISRRSYLGSVAPGREELRTMLRHRCVIGG